MRAVFILIFCVIAFGAFGCAEEVGSDEVQSPNTGEDGGSHEDHDRPDGSFNPDNPTDGGDTQVGKPDAGGTDEPDNNSMTGCTAGREICGDGLDNDCDQLADERCDCDDGAEQQCYVGSSEFAGVGQCAYGVQQCITTEEFNTWGACMGAVGPKTEVCNNGLDEDCDGKADEGCVCDVGDTRTCYGGSDETRGVGACSDGTLACLEHGDEGKWSDECVGEVTPTDEQCGNDVDEDCDGTLDNGCACDPDTMQPCYTGSDETRGVGACHDGTRTCEANDGEATWASCTGDVTPSAEVCGNDVDEDCDGHLDNDCATLNCPADVTTPAGDAVTFMATGSDVTNYAFTITGGPDGGPATAMWTGLSSTSPSATLTPIIIGQYTVRVTAQNTAGDALECSFNVTATPHGFRVQLLWDGTGDVDLHLINAAATAWSVAPNDAYWQNLTTTWGAVLDVDNIPGFGPENVRINTPAIGMTYTIGVHSFNNAGGRIATVAVFCGDSEGTTPQAMFTSHPLVQVAGGLCTDNDFWRVARVTFTSSTECTIEPIDDYVTAAAACMAR